MQMRANRSRSRKHLCSNQATNNSSKSAWRTFSCVKLEILRWTKLGPRTVTHDNRVNSSSSSTAGRVQDKQINQSINQSIVYLPFSFLTNYTSVVDFITLGQELSANPLGLFEESPWTSLQLWFYIKCTCLRYVGYS